MQQLEISRDDLVEAIRQIIPRLDHDQTQAGTIEKLLQLEYLLSNLYSKEEYCIHRILHYSNLNPSYKKGL